MANEKDLKNKKRFRKIWLMLALLVVVGLPLSYYAFYVYGAENQDDIRKITLSSFTANLADHRRYVRTTIILEYSSKKLEKELETSQHRIKDEILSVLRSKKVSDVDSAQKVEELKKELLRSINTQLVNGQITGLFFEEFIIQ
ncbi:MAG: flagellar basal body-associated FliL family protein [Syntrophomonadaceae bacterium]